MIHATLRYLFLVTIACCIASDGSSQTCSTPQNLSSGSITANSSVLSWDTVSNAVVYRVIGNAVGASSGSFNELTATNSFNFTGLNAGVSYWWSVRSICDSTGNSVSALATNDTFTTIIPVCDAPTNLTVDSVASTFANLSWDAVPGAVVYRLLGNANGAATGQVNVLVSDTTYQLTGLNPDISYWWTVRTICDSLGNLVSANAVNDTFSTVPLFCPVPQNISVTNVGETTATLNWDSVPGVIGYQIGGQSLSGSASALVLVPGGNTTSFSLSGLQPNETYLWRIRTWCDADELPSVYTENDTFTTIYDCPPALNLTADSITDTSVIVSWQSPSGGGTISSYTVYGNLVGTGTVVTIMVPGTQTDLAASGLIPNSSYQWAVLANCSGGGTTISPLSVIDTFQTTGPVAKRAESAPMNDRIVSGILFPNPMKESAVLDLKNIQDKPRLINIRDINGKVMQTIETTNAQQVLINRANMNAGIYFVEMIGTQVKLIKLVVQ